METQTNPKQTTSNGSVNRRVFPPHAIRWWILRAALGLGVLGNLLLRDGPWGLNATLWCFALAWSAFAFARRSALLNDEFEAWPLLLIVAGGVGMAWRDSGILFFAHFCTALLGAVLLVVQAGTGSVLRTESEKVVKHGISLATSFVRGIAPLVPAFWRDLRESGHEDRRVRTLGLGLLLAGPFLLVFGSLLVAADPLFQHYASRVLGPNWPRLISHAALSGFFTWIVGGALYCLFRTAESEGSGDVAVTPPDGAAALVALGLVAALLVTFLGVQLQAVLGGEEFVRETLGLTYSGHARKGFFQLIAVVALILPTLMAAHWSVRETSPRLEPRFRKLGWVVLASAAILLFSAFSRMRLYQSQYGLTELRFYTQVFMGWLGLVLVCFALTYLRGRKDWFFAGPLLSGLMLLLGLNVMNPEAIIVRANIERNLGPSSGEALAKVSAFDVSYGAQLSADAVPALVAALPRLNDRDRCALSKRLVDRWANPWVSDWRSWKLSKWQARRLAEGLERRLAVEAGNCVID